MDNEIKTINEISQYQLGGNDCVETFTTLLQGEMDRGITSIKISELLQVLARFQENNDELAAKYINRAVGLTKDTAVN